MIEGQEIVCVASAMWDGLWVNSQHIMWRLAAKNKILYIETTGLRAPSRNKSDLNKIILRLKNIIRGKRAINHNLTVVPPLTLPYFSLPIVRNFNNIVLRKQIQLILKQLGFHAPILWIFLPTGQDLVGKLNEKLVVYHCVDNYAANPGVSKENIISMENQLLKKADLVFTISPALYRDKVRYNENTHYLPNVVDVDHFKKALDPLNMPEDIVSIPKPIIGYVGNISKYKVDLSLLESIARQHPEWSIVLIGPVGVGDPATNISIIQRFPNIYILGAKPYENLPNYLKAFDVCIIPFNENSYTTSSFPLKFHEYLAAGKKIVSTPLPALQEYQEVAYFARNPEEFSGKIEYALENEISPDEWECRDVILKESSWEKRIDDISVIIYHAMEKTSNL